MYSVVLLALRPARVKLNEQVVVNDGGDDVDVGGMVVVVMVMVMMMMMVVNIEEN